MYRTVNDEVRTSCELSTTIASNEEDITLSDSPLSILKRCQQTHSITTTSPLPSNEGCGHGLPILKVNRRDGVADEASGKKGKKWIMLHHDHCNPAQIPEAPPTTNDASPKGRARSRQDSSCQDSGLGFHKTARDSPSP
ncbi:hypothetical protein M413DRAFT_32386 [Hebeloma cylindrosporum]|uniref:Uncharacterized protein n=1 Tax=Hebeloma cylindrosporum TaxID=76867 RepID=A0A0C2XCL2_HEBCY|nr:hypothetical protein M413DRAFT_32386 [Hebeloma cylindrosporum h7]